MRIDMQFHKDGPAHLVPYESLDEDRAQEIEAGSDSEIISHVTVEAHDEDSDEATTLIALFSIHSLQLSGGGGSSLEFIIQKVFQAGVEYGKTLPR